MLKYLASILGSSVTVKFKKNLLGRNNHLLKGLSHRTEVAYMQGFSLMKKHTDHDQNIYSRQKKLYVIHLLDLKWSIKQFNMYRSSTNKLPWIVLQTSGTSEVGTLCSIVNVFSTVLIHEDYHCVISVVYFMYSGREWEFQSLVELDDYLVQTRAFSFYQLLNFQSLFFFFSEANCWAFLDSFSKLPFGEVSL